MKPTAFIEETTAISVASKAATAFKPSGSGLLKLEIKSVRSPGPEFDSAYVDA